jgi:hypothetical protein
VVKLLLLFLDNSQCFSEVPDHLSFLAIDLQNVRYHHFNKYDSILPTDTFKKLHGKKITINNITIGGYALQNNYELEEYLKSLNSVDILIFNKEISDNKCLYNYIMRHKPKYIVHPDIESYSYKVKDTKILAVKGIFMEHMIINN